MAIKHTVQVGNKIIRAKSKTVSNVKTKEVRKVVVDLVDSMRHHELVGMAAPQIGRGLRIFVTEIKKTKVRKGEIDPLRVFINPKILSVSKKQVLGWEGCGSVASGDLFAQVRRPATVVIEALNQKGEKFKLSAKNLLARVIQHEFDHLEGVIFTDKANPKTYMSREELLKLRKKKKSKV